MIEFYINDLCHVTLTEKGTDVLERYLRGYLPSNIVNDVMEKIAEKDGVYESTLWNICDIFAPFMNPNRVDDTYKVFEEDGIWFEDFTLKFDDILKFRITSYGISILEDLYKNIMSHDDIMDMIYCVKDINDHGLISMTLYEFAIRFKKSFISGYECVCGDNTLYTDKQVEIRVGDMVELTGWMNTRYNGLIAEVIGTGKSWGGMKTCKVKVKNTEGKFIEESVTIDMVKKVK